MHYQNRFHQYFQAIVTQLIEIGLKSRCKIDAVEIPTIDPTKTYLFVANHQSRLDPFAIFIPFTFKQKLAIAYPTIRIMTAGSIYYSFLRPFLWACGCFPTRKRSDSNYDPIQQSVNYLHEGNTVLIFPEGKRVLQSESQPRMGVEHILEKADTDLMIILVHLEWSGAGKYETLRLRYGYGDNTDTVGEVMEKIYAL